MIFGDDDVIAAIATPPGVGAIGIVRLSGKGALDVLKKIFIRGAAPLNVKSHQMYYGRIESNGEVIDEVMVCPFVSPRSYTREDMAEIYTHGGMLVTGRVLEAVINNGARLALKGEFTKRAFLNGRINLSQAEAVMDIISAESDAVRRAGLRQLGGGLSGRVSSVRDRILTWLAHIELSIDYPEHEDEAKNLAVISDEGAAVLADLRALFETASIGRLLKEGFKTAIVGRPNVGKSTLLNAVISEDRAIVTEFPGTTRDVLTEYVRIGDIALVLMDTAGLRDADDPVERIGVRKTMEAAEDADLVLYVADLPGGITNEDEENLRGLTNKKVVVVLSKADLEEQWEVGNQAPGICSAAEFVSVHVSGKTGAGLDKLFDIIKSLLVPGEFTQNDDIITRDRHKELIRSAVGFLEKAMDEIRNGIPEDLVSISLRSAYLTLGEVLGEEVADDILDRIFEEFCVGK